MRNVNRTIKCLSIICSSIFKINKTAKLDNKTVKESFYRDRNENQFSKDWSQIRFWGDETAKHFGIVSYDDIEKIAT